MDSNINIVKYKNRKLYDRTNKHYVNYNEIIEYIKTGHNISIISENKKVDITKETLTNIYTSMIKDNNNYDIQILHKLISDL